MNLRVLITLASVALVAACAETTSDSDFGVKGSTYIASNGDEIVYGSMEDFMEKAPDRVFFNFDNYSLSPEAISTLKMQAKWLEAYPATTVIIEGNCDERGTREYNLALGERRANAVKNYLVSQGINPNRISIISYGKERPAVMGSNEEAWAQNRRAVTVIQ